jgi:hypothetical protein
MLLMPADPLLGKVGGGWALDISTFLGPKWHSPEGSIPFHRAQKSLDPLLLALVTDLLASKALRTGRINHRSINSYSVVHMYLFRQVEGPTATRMHPAASVQAPLTHL